LASDADREFRIGPNDGPLAAEGATIKFPLLEPVQRIDRKLAHFLVLPRLRLFVVGRNRPSGLFLGSW
jgi:hypothetical protein